MIVLKICLKCLILKLIVFFYFSKTCIEIRQTKKKLSEKLKNKRLY